MLDRNDSFTLVGVGDVSPNRDDPPSIFRFCGDTFKKADIRFGQMEAPLSDRGYPAFVPHGPTRLRPNNVTALLENGGNFDVMSHACNHALDYGWDAFSDTLNALKSHNIQVIGAGKNIFEARKPAILERKGTKVGFLGYLSIVARGMVAEEEVPGCVPLRASHFYDQADWQAGTPPLIITKLFPEDRAAMEEDIKKLKPQVDILIVSMHAGVHFIPAVIAQYQKEAAYAAIDAGADLVLQHHAHILKGIETYKGKVIFYSLGNFALEHALHFPGKMKPWEITTRGLRTELYHIYPEQGYEKHHFHHDALKTLVAKAYFKDKKIQKVTYLPCYITPNLEPEVLTRKDPRAQEVFDYMKAISADQRLNVNFSWDGDEILIQ